MIFLLAFGTKYRYVDYYYGLALVVLLLLLLPLLPLPPPLPLSYYTTYLLYHIILRLINCLAAGQSSIDPKHSPPPHFLGQMAR